MKYVGAFLVICFFSHTFAHAEENAEIDLIGGLAVGYTSLEFNAKLDSTPIFPSSIVTATALYNKLFFVFSYGDSFGTNAVSEEEDVGDSNRTDLDITIGYRWRDSWNIFFGYKDSETEIQFRERDSNIVRDEYYRKDGWFVGVTSLIHFERSGTLSFNVGYIYLSTDNLFRSDDDGDGDIVEEFDDLNGKHRGTADGWSYGVSWLIPVNKRLFYNTTLKINDYSETIKADGRNFSANQKLTFFNTGVLYLF